MPFLFAVQPEQCMTFGLTLAKVAGVLLVLDIWGIYFEYCVINRSRRLLEEEKVLTPVVPIVNDAQKEERDGENREEQGNEELDIV